MGDNTIENSLLEESIVAEPTETNEEDKENDNAEDASRNYGLQVPLSRIKKIMKTDPELHLASQDAVFLVAKATELFIEVLTDAAHHHTLAATRKTLQGKDVSTSITDIDSLAFLDGAI